MARPALERSTWQVRGGGAMLCRQIWILSAVTNKTAGGVRKNEEESAADGGQQPRGVPAAGRRDGNLVQATSAQV